MKIKKFEKIAQKRKIAIFGASIDKKILVSHDYHPKKHFDSTDDLVFPHKLKSIEEVSSEEEDKPEFSNVMKIKFMNFVK